MNREIKFRVWDKHVIDTGMMIAWDYVRQSGYFNDALSGKYPIMQYAGLKDKNDNDIYEGDIVDRWDNIDSKTNNEPLRGIIEYEDCAFILQGFDRKYRPDTNWIYADNIEIVGNIFEHLNQGGVYLSSLTSLPDNIAFNNQGGVDLSSLTEFDATECGNEKRNIQFVYGSEYGLRVVLGCFIGTKNEAVKAIQEKYGKESKAGKDYISKVESAFVKACERYKDILPLQMVKGENE